MKNINWTRDETILALDLYIRDKSAAGNASHLEVINLSALLNKLPIIPNALRDGKFRNPNGVGMKLANIQRYDPSYSGKALAQGAKLEGQLWMEFANDPVKLQKTSEAIKINYSQISEESIFVSGFDEDDEAPEGSILSKVRKYRERNKKLVAKKKKWFISQFGCLSCEVCEFDFLAFYGLIGNNFAECHHEIPVSELKPNSTTKLSDLRIVCANCHRMIHRSRPWLSVGSLRKILSGNAQLPTFHK